MLGARKVTTPCARLLWHSKYLINSLVQVTFNQTTLILIQS